MFLSVYTPTHARPLLLAECEASVQMQSVPVEHVIVHDREGIGIAGVYAAMPRHADRVTGEYVMVLSDDNVLADEEFAEDLEWRANEMDRPDVIVFRGQIEGSLQPLVWMAEPVITRIDLSCFAVKRNVWQLNADQWGHRYEGDFDFIHHLWDAGYRFDWWDHLGFRALQIGRGAPEPVA